MDHPPTKANGDRLRTVGGTQFLHDVLDVDLDGFLGDRKLLGNIAVAVAARKLSQNLDLSGGEGLVAKVLGQMGGDLGRNALFPA